MSSERVPCDPCRQRRVRCDGLLPCASCQRSQLACRREYARKRRGRKHGSGKVIAALRGHQSHLEQEGCDILSPENLPRVMKRCVDVYLHHLYPIMPLFKPSALTEWLDRPLELNERSMLLALCALVTTFMCGHSESIIGAVEWESVARRFIQMSLSVRSDYNFVEDSSTVTLLGSFFVAVSHVELHQARQSWFYLREAITLAHGLRLHTDEFYRGMEHMDALYCRRIYDILFVTERSFAISRHKPVLLSQPLLLPAHVPDKEHKELSAVDLGFRQLVQVYAQLDVDFLNFWSQEGSVFSGSQQEKRGFDPVLLDSGLISNTHKADILVTQHWLNLVYWRAALQQSLLSTKAEPRSRTFSYPEDLALSLLRVLSSLPAESVEVHGLGIFEKINDIGISLADFTQCSAELTGWTEKMAQNLDRLVAIQQHLSLSPNSHSEFAVSLGRRLAEYSFCYSSPLDMFHELGSANNQDVSADHYEV